MAGCVAEAVYCLLLKVSYLRTLVSGSVKTAGGMAAVYAVTPDPSPWFLACLFLWLFFWEIETCRRKPFRFDLEYNVPRPLSSALSRCPLD